MSAHPALDTVARSYLVAGLAVGEIVDGFVDSFHGPETLRETARSTRPEAALQELLASIETLDPSPRRTWFEAQYRALQATLDIAGGRLTNYREQVRSCFDIEAEWQPDDRFVAAHETLESLLPGEGTIGERQVAWRQQFELETDRILSVAGPILDDLRDRTRQIVSLPDGESFDLVLVQNQPWSGYNWYLGDSRSRIEINTDLPVRLNALPDLLAHEGYPGHHTEHSVREVLQYRERGEGEFAIALLTTPQAVISEGIATNALEAVVPEDELPGWLRDTVYSPAGMDVDIERDLEIARASRVLSGAMGNAALLVHDRGESVDTAVEYLVRYGLRSEKEARQSMEFVMHPLFRTYVYTYSVGYELVHNALQSQPDRKAAFRDLLTRHWTPGMLRG